MHAGSCPTHSASTTRFALPNCIEKRRSDFWASWTERGPWTAVAVLTLLLVVSGSFNLCLACNLPDSELSAITWAPFGTEQGSARQDERGIWHSRRTSSQSGSAPTSSSSSSHGGPHKQDALLFLFNALVIGTAVTHLTTLPAFHGLQQTVVIFTVGVIYSLIQEGLDVKKKNGVFGESYEMWMEIDPHLLLFTLLPPLLAGDAMAIDTAVAKRVAKQCLYLATVGVLVNGLLTAAFLMFFLGWSFLLSLMTGAILCATDPVAVVALLKELGASPTLTVQIQGESLLNDGTAIVLFTISYNMISGKDYDASQIVMFLIKTAAMAWGLGMLIGWLFFRWIKASSNRLNHSSTNIQISLTLCCAYWSFIMAEGVFHISGVLSTVAASLMLAGCMWPHIVSEEAMHHVWHTFETLGNVIIFFLAGALTGNAMVHIDAIDYVYLVVIYLVLLLIRGLLLFVSLPVLKYLNPGRQDVSMADAVVMTWGGLRGAVGLALAVQVRIQQAADDDGNTHINSKDAQRILFYVAGVAFLTLIINATTCPLLVKELGIAATPDAKKDLQRMLHSQLVSLAHAKGHPLEVKHSLELVLHDVQKHIHRQKTRMVSNEIVSAMGSWTGPAMLRSGSDADAIQHSQCLIDEFEEIFQSFELLSLDEIALLGHIPTMLLRGKERGLIDQLSSQPIDWLRTDAVKSAMLNLVYAQYWHFLETRDLTPGSVEAEVLLTSISLSRSQVNGELIDFYYIVPHILYTEEEICSFGGMGRMAERVRKNFKSERIISRRSNMANYRSTLKRTQTESKMVNHGFVHTKGCIESTSFNITMAVMIMLNGVYILIEEDARNSSNENDNAWLVIEVGFTAIFTVECVLKLVDQGCSYFVDLWNDFDLALVLTGIAGLVINAMVPDTGDNNVSNEARIVRVARVFRVLRLLRLFRLLRFIEVLKAKLSQEEYSFEVAEHMQKMKMLMCFIKGHLLAQKEFFLFFCGSEAQIHSVEVSRCMLQSQTFVYMALCLAVKEVQELDKDVIIQINNIRSSKELTEELEDFVLDAYGSGVLAGREAEAVLVPLHKHIKECMKAIQSSQSGHTVKQNKIVQKLSQQKSSVRSGELLGKITDAFNTTSPKSRSNERNSLASHFSSVPDPSRHHPGSVGEPSGLLAYGATGSGPDHAIISPILSACSVPETDKEPNIPSTSTSLEVVGQFADPHSVAMADLVSQTPPTPPLPGVLT